MSDSHPIGLSVRNAVKVYPGTRALKGVDFDIRMSAVNVLVGENGAGKSTLMKVVAGVESLTSGKILIDDTAVTFSNKQDAVNSGIGIVFQELNLFPEMSVSENIFIGREPVRFGVDINRSQVEDETRSLMRRLETAIEPNTVVGHLRIGQQQIVEIAKALAQNAKFLILDEPTSALSAQEVDILFSVINELKNQGVGIVYISHRLEELIEIGDYITVLRDGEISGSRSMQGVDTSWIVEAMIGDKSKDFSAKTQQEFGPEIFRAEEVCLPKPGGGFTVNHLSLSVRSGEIVGLYGLMGAGRTEFLECVMAQHASFTGQFFIDGKKLTKNSVADRIARGIALIPEDRKRDGLIQIMSIRENLTLSVIGRLSKASYVGPRLEASIAKEFIKRLTIKVANMENPVSSLSGGNQQKVVIGKALMTKPKLLLMDEPSRGIDVGAKAEIYRTMRTLAAEGIGIIFVTSDLDEIQALADRIYVMADGRCTGEFAGDSPAETLIAAATPAKNREAVA